MAVVQGDASVLVEHEVRELVRRRGIDPLTDPRSLADLVTAVLSDYDRRALRGDVPPLADPAGTRKAVQDAVGGLGPLQQYLDDDEVEEIWVNSPSQVFVARRGVPELTTTLLTEAGVRDLVERMLRLSGRRLDLSTPFVDAALPGGERLHVAIPDVTRRHWAVNIRKFVARATHLDDLVALGSLTAQAARFLHAAVAAGLNVLVSGPTQAGKATISPGIRSLAAEHRERAQDEHGANLSCPARCLLVPAHLSGPQRLHGQRREPARGRPGPGRAARAEHRQ